MLLKCLITYVLSPAIRLNIKINNVGKNVLLACVQNKYTANVLNWLNFIAIIIVMNWRIMNNTTYKFVCSCEVMQVVEQIVLCSWVMLRAALLHAACYASYGYLPAIHTRFPHNILWLSQWVLTRKCNARAIIK